MIIPEEPNVFRLEFSHLTQRPRDRSWVLIFFQKMLSKGCRNICSYLHYSAGPRVISLIKQSDLASGSFKRRIPVRTPAFGSTS
jgi:hypothetical protein